MKAGKEKDCLIKLLYQYLALDESELARVTFSRLHQIDNQAARQLLGCLPDSVETDGTISKNGPDGRSYTWSQMLYCVASPLKFAKEEGRGDAVLRLSLGVLIDHLKNEEVWETNWYGENEDDAPDGLGGSLKKSHVEAITDGIKRILDGSAPGKVKNALKQAAESRGIVLYGISSTLRDSLTEKELSTGGISQFLHICEQALITAVDMFLEKGNMKSALKTLGCLQGDRMDASNYQNMLQRVTKYMPTAFQCQLLQELMGSSNARELSCILQEMLDVDLKQRILEDGVDGSTDGSVLVSKKRISDFQESRVMQWHVGEKLLQAMVGDVMKGTTNLEKLMKEGKKRMACFAVLMAWDSLGSRKLDQVFQSRSALVQGINVASVKDSDLSLALGNIKAQAAFAKLIANRQVGKNLETAAGKVLSAFSSISPLAVMHQATLDMDSQMIEGIVGCLSYIPPTAHLPILRDTQLLTASGVIVSMVGILKISSRLIDGCGEISDQEKWISEAKGLMESIRICLKGLNGSFIHAWILSVLSSVFRLIAVKPEEAAGIDVQFVMNETKFHATGDNNKIPDVIDFLGTLISMLSDSANTGHEGLEEGHWDVSAGSVHFQFVQESLAGIQSGLIAAMSMTRKHRSLIQSHGGWKDLGSFLLLGESCFEILNQQSIALAKPAPNIMEEIKQNLLNGPVHDITEKMCLLVDACLSQSTDWEFACAAAELVLQAQGTISSPTDAESFRVQSLFYAADAIHKVLEGSKGVTDIGQMLGKCQSTISVEGRTPLRMVPRVRRLTEHIKALARLRDAVRAANRGRLQYLSGLLHNMSRALTDDDSLSDLRCGLEVAGYGPSLDLAAEARRRSSLEAVMPVASTRKNNGYLSEMVDYLAAVGDVVSTWDDGPTEGHNYFAMLGQSPQEILSILVSKSRTREHIDAVAKVGSVLQVDIIGEVIKTWVKPITSPMVSCTNPDLSEDATTLPTINPSQLRNFLTLEAVGALSNLSPVRVLLMCVMYTIQSNMLEIRTVNGKEDCLEPASFLEDVDALTMYALEKTMHFPTLRTWLEGEVGKKIVGAIAATLKSEAGGTEKVNWVESQLEELLSAQKHFEALKFVETSFNGDVPDKLLEKIVDSFPADCMEDSNIDNGENGKVDPLKRMPMSLVACLKVKSKPLSIELARKRIMCWPLEGAILFYSLMNGQLGDLQSESDIAKEVALKVQSLSLYEQILKSQLGNEFKTWVEVNNLFESDPGQLVRRLIAAGASSEAIRVADMQDVPESLKLAAQATYTQELANGGSAKGSGPAAALRYLRTFSEKDAFQIGMKVLTSAPSLRLCQLLAQFLMSLKDKLPQESIQQLKKLELGLSALRCLPSAWSDRCAHLVETPEFILESLIMAQQTVTLRKLLKMVPELQDDSLIIHYARKALGLDPDEDCLPSFLMNKQGLTSSSSKLTVQDKTAGSQPPKRILSRFPSETLQGGAGVAVNVLSGISSVDEGQREKHAYRGQPNVTLFRVLLDMLSGPTASAKAAARAAADLAQEKLEEQHSEFDWNPVVAQQMLDVVDICIDILGYCEKKLPQSVQSKISASNQALTAIEESETNFEDPPHDVDTLSPKQVTDVSARDANAASPARLRIQIELLQKILEANIRSSLSVFRDPNLCDALLHELVRGEQYNLAVSTAEYCGMDERPLWEAWVCALVQAGNFPKAKEKAVHVFRASKSNLGLDARAKVETRQAAMRLVRVLETSSPVDTEAFMRLQAVLKRSRWGFLRTTASSLISALQGGSNAQPVQQKPWWNPVKPKPSNAPPPVKLGDNLKKKVLAMAAISSTLLLERIKFGEEVLAAHAPALLIAFMFKHGRGIKACLVMFPPGMEDEVAAGPSVSASSGKFRTSFRSTFARSQTGKTQDIGSRSSVLGRRNTSRESHSGSDNQSETASTETQQRSSVLSSVGQGPAFQGPSSASASTNDVDDRPPQANREVVIAGVDPHTLACEIEDVQQLCDLSVRYGQVEAMIDAMVKGGSRGRRCLKEACTWFQNEGKIWHLYRCQRALEQYDIAALTCLKLSCESRDGTTALRFLESARDHFQEALSSFQKSSVAPKEKPVLTQSGLAKYISRCKLQADVYTVEEDNARRLKVVVNLVVNNFNLAFRVLFEFNMAHSQAYAIAACTMAESRHHEAIRKLIHNIKGTVTDADLDKILGAAVEAYTSSAADNAGDEFDWTAWFAEGCIELMVRPHAKVMAYLQLGDTDRAYRIAKERGGYQDLTMVAEAAQKLGDRATAKKCEKILGRSHIGG